MDSTRDGMSMMQTQVVILHIGHSMKEVLRLLDLLYITFHCWRSQEHTDLHLCCTTKAYAKKSTEQTSLLLI